jgi:hypothetical protein
VCVCVCQPDAVLLLLSIGACCVFWGGLFICVWCARGALLFGRPSFLSIASLRLLPIPRMETTTKQTHTPTPIPIPPTPPPQKKQKTNTHTHRTRIIFAREELQNVKFTRSQGKYLCEEAIRCVVILLPSSLVGSGGGIWLVGWLPLWWWWWWWWWWHDYLTDCAQWLP